MGGKTPYVYIPQQKFNRQPISDDSRTRERKIIHGGIHQENKELKGNSCKECEKKDGKERVEKWYFSL